MQTIYPRVLRRKKLKQLVCIILDQPTDDNVQLNTPILMYDKDGKSMVMTLDQLLPMSFGPEKLLTMDEMASGLSQ